MPEAKDDANANFILRTMVAMAAADGSLDAREITLIQQVYRDLTGGHIATRDIMDAREANARGGSLLNELAVASSTMDLEAKEEIIRSAYLVLLADDHIAGEERRRLKDISAALQIPEIHFGAILEDLAVWLAAQKG